jgi:hypothetical protein
LQAALEQVKNISLLSLPDFANTVLGIETNTGLNQITSLTEAVPDSVRTVIQSTVATGSGPNGTLYLGDVLGCASGFNITTPLNNVISTLANVNTTALQNIYQVMANTANLQYNALGNTVIIPGGLPGAGTYGNIDIAMANLCNLANSNISSIAASNSNAASSLNSDWAKIANVVSSQNTALANGSPSGINYANLQANLKSIIPTFVDSLHDWGVQIQPGGPNEYLTSVANVSTQTGQAIVGTLREGRNLEKLKNGGVGVDSEIPAT